MTNQLSTVGGETWISIAKKEYFLIFLLNRVPERFGEPCVSQTSCLCRENYTNRKPKMYTITYPPDFCMMKSSTLKCKLIFIRHNLWKLGCMVEAQKWHVGLQFSGLGFKFCHHQGKHFSVSLITFIANAIPGCTHHPFAINSSQPTKHKKQVVPTLTCCD